MVGISVPPSPAAIPAPTISAGSVRWSPGVASKVRPIASFPLSPTADLFLVEIHKNTSPISTARTYQVSANTSGNPPLIDVFIAIHGLSTAIAELDAAAKAAFGDAVSMSRSIRSDPDLGGDYIRLEYEVSAMARAEFRSKREMFEELSTQVSSPSALDRIVFVASRAA